MIRFAALSVGVLLLFAIGQYAMNHWTQWSAETKASVWVAVGTLLLAVATAWSVWETRLVIRGEDRRHQQSLAPFLTLGDSVNSREQYEHGYTLWNRGTGIALGIEVEVCARIDIGVVKPPPSGKAVTVVKDHNAFLEAHTAVTSHEVRDTYSCSASFPGGLVTFPQDLLKKPGGAVRTIEYSVCVIRYSDVFGNPYGTRYTDDRLGRYKWSQPESLSPRRIG